MMVESERAEKHKLKMLAEKRLLKETCKKRKRKKVFAEKEKKHEKVELKRDIFRN
jgi:hypothetical protein